MVTCYPVLSFLFTFDKPEEYYFSFGYPFTVSMQQRFLAAIVSHNLAHT